MPYNPAGLFSLVASYLAQPGTTIRTEQHNPVFEDVASALSSVLVRDGRAPMTGPLNMNGFAIANIAAGSSPENVATLAQAMPIGAVIDFAGSTAPAGWALCYGQAVSRTIYSTLFSLIGTTYGEGDGSTTFNLPDLRGRVVAGVDNMGGTAASRLTSAGSSVDGATRGASGGDQSHTIAQANLPNVNFDVTIPSGQGSHRHAYSRFQGTSQYAAGFEPAAGGGNVSDNTGFATLPQLTGTAASGGSGTALKNVQPTFILNKIIRVSYDG